MAIRFVKYGRKISWIEKRYWKYGRKVSWIVKWFGKYGRKVSLLVKRYGKYGRKMYFFKFTLCLTVRGITLHLKG